jgi:hypothetical protein
LGLAIDGIAWRRSAVAVSLWLDKSLPINVQLTRSLDAYMGRPGNKWKVELTRKNVSPIRVTDGSGANPGMIGLIVVMMSER